jgi:diacylglycerol O-acyltransferase
VTRPPHAQRLSQMDRSFLVYENPRAPMHVGAVVILDARPLRTDEGGVDVPRIEEYLASRLHLIPRYRQRLAWTPVERHPVWVDDDRFQLRYHVRHTRLPRPGSERQLARVAGRIFSQHLDRDRPLWELWVIEGLEGDRFALVTKIHHCMADGVAGAELLAALLTATPVAKPDPPPVWLPRPPPGDLALARDALAHALATPFEVAGAAWEAVRAPRAFARRARELLGAASRTLASGIGPAPPTPFNQPIGPYRRVAWLVMDLPRVRRTAKALGGTVNDVVLTTVAGGVRRFLRRHRHEDVDHLDFRVLTPVNTRRPTPERRFGNYVSAWIVRLPLDERDPRAAFRRVHEQTVELKERHAERAVEALARTSALTGPLLLALGARLVNAGAAPFQMVVTNVPGPRQQLYLLEAPLLDVHPLVPLLGTLGIGIAVFSYRDHLSWGFTADWDLVPDLHAFVAAIETAFERLCRAAGTAEKKDDEGAPPA